jgi:hypothetical protein
MARLIRRRGRHAGQLPPDDSHLVAILFVRCDATHLRTKRRADPLVSGGRVQSVRISQPATREQPRTSPIVRATAGKDANDDDGPGVEVELQPHAPVADS